MSVDPFRRWEEPKEISEVNVVPLADVSLVLLIILLILSPMMTQAMLQIQAAGRGKDEPPPAEQPPTEPAAAQPQDLVLVVALGTDVIAVGDKSFKSTAEFMAFMAGELGKRADKKVFLTPHPDVTHGKVVNMIESLKDCGASSVALVQVEEAQSVPAGVAVSSGAPSVPPMPLPEAVPTAPSAGGG
jgi:biopolymer transport protein ExbD